MKQTLSSLSRGKGFNGDVFEDHKIHFLKTIPYTLDDITSRRRNTKHDVLMNFNWKKPTGTYLTETGQLILYTQAQKAKGLNQETATLCKNICNIYDGIQSISPLIKDENINEMKNENKFGDISTAVVSLKNNWFFPKQWKSPAKSLIPMEILKSGTDLRTFTKSKIKSFDLNSSNNDNVQKYLQIIQKYQDKKTLPKIIFQNMNLITKQRQNNAVESNSISSSETVILNGTAKSSVTEHVSESSQNITEQENPFLESDNDETFYEADDELIICTKKNKTVTAIGDDEKLIIDYMNLSDILGSDLTWNDKICVESSSITAKFSKSMIPKQQKTEELRINILKDMYDKLKFLSLIKNQMKSFGENLLDQFQRFNKKNRKLRIKKNQETLYDVLKDMRDRNEEIHLRLQNLSEQQLLDQKNEMGNSDFRKKWDIMLLELSIKSKKDNESLQKRMTKLILNEEIKLKEIEYKQISLEQSSIKYAFTKLKEELIKIEEKKNEIEHFILRLEMKRENINKIEREIQTITPEPFLWDLSNVLGLLKNIKEEIIILWKSKMGETGNNFKVDEIQMNNLNKDVNINNLAKEKGDMNPLEDELKITERKIEESFRKKSLDEESVITIKDGKNSLTKLEYEIMKHGQRITSNYTYSYFVPWKNDSYERSYKIPPSTDAEFTDNVKLKTSKLNYKRILANNPLLTKQKMYHKNTLSKIKYKSK